MLKTKYQNNKLLNKNKISQVELTFNSNDNLNILLGQNSENLDKLNNIIDVEISFFGNKLLIVGENQNVELAKNLINKVYDLLLLNKNNNQSIDFSNFETEYKMLKKQNSVDTSSKILNSIDTWKRTIYPKSDGQKRYLQAINEYDVIFGLGPAGTGKSYLAVAKAVQFLKKGNIDKIILSRPAVEAGENLGFLPGDMKDKVDPYLRPIYDALYEMIPFELVEKKIQEGIIEIAPVAFMRGRTFKNSFIIIDEAQNTSSIQMKMILTRLGHGSKMIVNGDLTQIDIKYINDSGLSTAKNKLAYLKTIKFVNLNKKDVVRHKIVSEIISAYEK
tara:strand:- start:191 stop:1186 length:996 start_codon:yes stop_codon:yes gene_type:complete